MLDVSFFLLGLNVNEHALPNGTEPLIFLDFKNGVYTADGVTVTVADLLVQNTDYGTWNAATMINGSGAGGVGGSGAAAPVFTGAALDLVLDGATTLTTLASTGVEDNFRYEMTDDLSDYNTYYYSQSGFVADQNLIGDGNGLHPDIIETALADGTHHIALTFIDGKISRSTDGTAIITINPAVVWTPVPAFMGFVIPIGMRVEQIGIYPAQPDGDLPTLSSI